MSKAHPLIPQTFLYSTLETLTEWEDWVSPKDLGCLLDVGTETAANYLSSCWTAGWLDCRYVPPRKGRVNSTHRLYRINHSGVGATRSVRLWRKRREQAA